MKSLRTIEELEWALEHDFNLVRHYEKQVTVLDDLSIYLKWLHDNEKTTKLVTELKRHKRRAKGIHPSSASKKKVCLLKLYYECTFEVEPNRAYDQQAQLTWDIGTMLHDLHQLYFEKIYGDQFRKEVKLKTDDGYIQSRTDGIFDFPALRFILEAKSIKEGGNYGFETVQHKPMEDHVRQAHFYMWLADIPYALIFYIAKNTSEYAEHVVTFNPKLWDDIMDNVIVPVVEAAYLDGPPVEPSPGWHCRWCDFAHGCPEKGGQDDEVEWQDW